MVEEKIRTFDPHAHKTAEELDIDLEEADEDEERWDIFRRAILGTRTRSGDLYLEGLI